MCFTTTVPTMAASSVCKKVSKSKYDNTIAKYMKNSIEVKIK